MAQATKPVLTGRTVTLRPLTRLDAPAIHAGLEEPEAKRLKREYSGASPGVG